MGRSPCCVNGGLKRGPWTPEEDQKLLAFIEEHGHGSWPALPAKAGLQRCGKSCRLRWTNYLRPDIKRGKFSLQEEQTIIQLHALLGNRWSAIATHLPRRTDNEIKNYWNTHLKKRLTKMGIDPVTHKPKKSDALSPGQQKVAATLSHIAQWESARLEAEARAARESPALLRSLSSHPIPFQTHHNDLGLASSSSSSSAQAQAQAHLLLLLNKADAPPPPPPPQPLCLDVLTAWKGAWLKTLVLKENAISGGIFATTTGTIESPTSTLNFLENQLPIPTPTTASFAKSCLNKVEEEAELGKLNNNVPQLKESIENNNNNNNNELIMHFHQETEDANAVLLPSFMEGLTDLLIENSHDLNDGGGCNSFGSDDFEENKNYWNSILNLVNCTSPPAGSPVF